MKKLKIPVLVLLTLGILIVFALLPRLFSAALDIRLNGMPSFWDMLSVELNSDPQPDGLSPMDKLAFLSAAEATGTTQDQMAMNEEAVMDAVSAFLYQCEASGIFQPFEPAAASIQPKLLYDLTDPETHMFVWTVTMLYKKEPNQRLLVDVDDETGQILCISYAKYEQFSMDGVWERNKAVADAISDIYFSQLGLQDIRQNNADSASDGLWDLTYYERDGGVTEAVYVFRDTLYGEFTLQFTVDGAGGFSTSFYK